jgi:hypothetical protein
MTQVKKNNPSSVAADEFDVSEMPIEPAASPALDDEDETEDVPVEQQDIPAPVQVLETPQQRRLMRNKRIAKAEEEQLRRLMRQFPVVMRLVLENLYLKEQLEQIH